MNRHDERRPRFWRHGRERDESVRDQEYRFEPGKESGRTAGDSDQQPYSQNPYGYYPGQGPGQDRSGREWGGRWGRGPESGGGGPPQSGGERWSQPYGQREPYNARGGSERSRWGGPWRDEGSSRYSESQYGARRSSADPYADRYEPEFGEGPFADTSQSPGYFGSRDTFTREHAAREQRRNRTGPKGYTRSDDRIREDICERLMLADGIDSSEMSVSVKDGRVTLEGSVPTRSMKHAIEDLADYTAGVQDVDNRVRVERAGTSTQTASGITPTSGSSKTTKQ